MLVIISDKTPTTNPGTVAVGAIYSELRQSLQRGQEEAAQYLHKQSRTSSVSTFSLRSIACDSRRANAHTWVAWSTVAFCAITTVAVPLPGGGAVPSPVLFGLGWVCAVFMAWSMAACVDEQSLAELIAEVPIPHLILIGLT